MLKECIPKSVQIKLNCVRGAQIFMRRFLCLQHFSQNYLAAFENEILFIQRNTNWTFFLYFDEITMTCHRTLFSAL